MKKKMKKNTISFINWKQFALHNNECYGDGIDDHAVDKNNDNDIEVMMSWMMILIMMTYSTDDI
jgi:hypothetical protein